MDTISNLTLIDSRDGKALRMECSFRQMNITDGAKLLLF
jgi:hypothetical protein